MLTTRVPATPVHPSTGRLRPLGLGEVRITGGFWAERQQTNAAATLPHIAHWLEREGWIGNYDLAAAGRLPEGRRGREFSDSEIYKFLEAASWELGRRPDAALEATFRSFVSRVAAAQEADGYLSTAFGRPGQPPRWSDLAWGHELYCLGHLFQAAVARERTAPGADDGLLGIARRAADLVCDVFGEDGIQSVCGHAEVEVGLAELSRVTGEPRYLHQARLFIERRGHHVLPEPEWGRAYFQDDLPIREATVQRGHTVRANYLAAGAVDVAVETGDAELLGTLRGVWDRTVARRTYLTGGQGSHFQDEAFGEDWELPPDRAYSETCASIASIMFSWRLLLATGGGGYADLIERTLFNVVATAVSREGDRFFYTNTLHRRAPGEMPDPDVASPRAFSSLRAPVVRGVLLPAEHRPDAGQPCRAAGDRRRRRPPAAAVRHLFDLDQPARRDAGRTRGGDRLPRHRDGDGAGAASPPPGPGRSACVCPAWADGRDPDPPDRRRRPAPSRSSGPMARADRGVRGRRRRRARAADGRGVPACRSAGRRRSAGASPCSAGRWSTAPSCRPTLGRRPRPAGGQHGDAAALRGRASSSSAPAGCRPRTSRGPMAAPQRHDREAGESLALIPYHDWGQAGLCTMRVWLPEA